ncbi:hypothetical protein DCC85_01585 [Paenibacillus sp. CAA11]|uniref:glycerophosphodiester phosphodiesterase family protein n=1 Tax=Paenibacillus sp. CAA11 TaxID=1532905 RepID=UPI000D358566|nr:glycerophosphodiester phosphodiesterase family protein [Paenibacillus sp. CAA11]AWB43051.1 hypothetical protein DCC85_01585 [Paenibacillus sp. CAA11]
MKNGSRYLSIFMLMTMVGGTVLTGLGAPHAYADSPFPGTERKAMEVRKAVSAPVVDGRLEESAWQIATPLDVATVQGAAGGGEFGLLWDNDYLYVGVNLRDDQLIYNGNGAWFEQDSISLFLDPTKHQSAPFAEQDMQLGIVYQPDTMEPEFHFGAALDNHSGKDESRIRRAISKTGMGWTAEIAVPWDMLGFDPRRDKEMGFEISATDRQNADDSSAQVTRYWTAYQKTSFWNDTEGYGVITFLDQPVGGDEGGGGSDNSVLLSESFDGYAAGEAPAGWSPFSSGGAPAMTIVESPEGGGVLQYEGTSPGMLGGMIAPVQGSDYTVETDIRFEEAGEEGGAAVLFGGSNSGFDFHYLKLKPGGKAEWGQLSAAGGRQMLAEADSAPLDLGKRYKLKLRVFGEQAQASVIDLETGGEHQLGKQTLPALPPQGLIGLGAEASKVQFDNVKVTRLKAERLDLALEDSLQALTGPVTVTGSVYYSDGATEEVEPSLMKLYSSDESTIKVVDNQLYPIKEGSAVIKGVFRQAEAERTVTVTPSIGGVSVVTLRPESGYVLAVTGEPMDISKLNFSTELSDFSKGTLRGDELEWSFDSAAVRLTDGRIRVQQKGVYTATVSKDGATAKVVIAAKDQADSEYVLYEENFDQLQNGTLPDGWTRIEGATASKAAVKDGGFEILADQTPDNPIRVLLPHVLEVFGDYTIEADMSFLSANDAARWNSLMFRIQNQNYPYYQMAVRSDATAANGVEFAERTKANSWNVMERGSHTERLEFGKPYHYAVKVKGARVQEWIDHRLIIDTDQAGAYLQGGIGLQANGSTLRVDNLRVTLQDKALPALPAERFVQVTEPQTQIAAAPSVVTEIQSAEDLAKLQGSTVPATAILHVNAKLEVTDAAGKSKLGQLEQVLNALGGRSIPAFYIRDDESVIPLADLLKSQGIEDAFVISDDGELVKRLRAAVPMIRGIVDFTGKTVKSEEDLMEIRRETTLSQAKIALLSPEAATRKKTDYLEERTIVVWAKEDGKETTGNLSLHRLITAGVNGMVTSRPEAAFQALELYNHEATLIRKPYLIGHRGMPANSPENTIESNLLAYEAGADFIENDMYLTKDGNIVIIHDSVLQNTTNGRGNVEDFTVEELKKLNANKPYPQGFPDVKIPTLGEQLDLVKSKGIMLYAELKTSTPEAVDAFIRIMKEKDAESAVNTMSFTASQLKRMAELMPEMPLGLLTGGYASETNVNKSLRETQKLLQGLNATFNTSYGGVGKNFVEAAKHRGILISPWTLNNKAELMKFFKMGVYGLTTDYSLWMSDWAASVKPEQDSYKLRAGEAQKLKVQVQTYKREEQLQAPEVVVIDGQDVIQASGDTVTAKKAGQAHVLLRYTASLEPGNVYDLYSEPVAITVTGSGSPGGGSGGGNDGGSGSGSGGGNAGGSAAGASGTSSSGNSGSQPGNASQGKGSASSPLAAVEGKLDGAAVKQAFAERSKVYATFEDASVQLPASALREAAKQSGASLSIGNSSGAYQLPVSLLDPAVLAKLLGAKEEELSLRFTIRELGAAESKAVTQAITAAGGTPAAGAVQFTAEAVNADGQARPINFGPAYVTRELRLKGAAAPAGITGLEYRPDKGELRFVPALLENGAGSAGPLALLKHRASSGIYTAAVFNKSFADLDGHWAKESVEQLANRLLLKGTDASRFEPGREVTRSEFTVMLVRAIGLLPAASQAGYADAGAWYASDVAAAAAAGIVTGLGDGSFRPDDKLTRAQQAVMIARALAAAGSEVKVSEARQQELLARFADGGNQAWAKQEVAAMLEAGLMKGTGSGRLDLDQRSSRAESAALLARMLIHLGFMK